MLITPRGVNFINKDRKVFTFTSLLYLLTIYW